MFKRWKVKEVCGGAVPSRTKRRIAELRLVILLFNKAPAAAGMLRKVNMSAVLTISGISNKFQECNKSHVAAI